MHPNYPKRELTIETEARMGTTNQTTRNPFSKKFLTSQSNKTFTKVYQQQRNPLDTDFPRPLDPKNLLKTIEISYRKTYESFPSNSTSYDKSPKKYETCYNRLKHGPMTRTGSGLRGPPTATDVSKNSEKFARPRSERYGKIVSNFLLQNLGAEKLAQKKLRDCWDGNLEKLRSFGVKGNVKVVGGVMGKSGLKLKRSSGATNGRWERLIETIEEMKKMVKRDLG